ncbi:MAG: GtrA family protein [Actinomyces sp.]|nr:GtrA family protein [Actinomyces sp.]
MRDSLRIYAQLLAFSGASLVSFGVDLAALLVLQPHFTELLAPVVLARVLSASVNHGLNRRVLRARRGAIARSALRHTALALGMLIASWAALSGLTSVGLPLWASKVIGEGGLYVVSYRIQQKLVFAPMTPGRGEQAEDAPLTIRSECLLPQSPGSPTPHTRRIIEG